jgi:hypothetical protein
VSAVFFGTALCFDFFFFFDCVGVLVLLDLLFDCAEGSAGFESWDAVPLDGCVADEVCCAAPKAQDDINAKTNAEVRTK